MRLKTQACATMMLAVLTAFCLSGVAQQSRSPLSEQDITKLLKMGASAAAIAAVVEQYGVNFEASKETLNRLKQLGAQDTLLETIRGKAPSPPPPPNVVVSKSETPADSQRQREV